MFGKIRYDVRVEPRSIREEEQLLAKRIFDAENSKSKLKIISRNKASSIVNPGTAGAVNWAGSFIVMIPIAYATESSKLTPLIRKILHLLPSLRRAKYSRLLVSPRTSFSI